MIGSEFKNLKAAKQVVLNAQLLSGAASYRGAGVSHYSRSLLTALGELASEGATPLRFTALTHTPEFQPAGVRCVVSALPLERPPLRIAWEQTVLPGKLERLDADLVHGLVNVLPLATRVPGVVTVHDLSFLRLPEKFPAVKRLYLTGLAAASTRRAAQVIAVSRQTAGDLARFLRIPPGKITVIYNGVDGRFVPGRAEDAAAFRRRKGLPPRYLLFVGTLEPRKNLETLITAYAAWRARIRAGEQAMRADEDVHLVLVGARGWFYDEIFRRVARAGLEAQVHFAGYVPGSELPEWYRAAEACVYPSLFEGFGLPVLEAMACGTPVLCSAAPGVAEAAGEAALTVPPTDREAWVAGLALITGQPELRGELRRRGLARAAGLSWRRAAEATLGVYETIIGRSLGRRSAQMQL